MFFLSMGCYSRYYNSQKNKEGKQLLWKGARFDERSRREKREDPKEGKLFLKKTDILVSNSYV